MAVRKKTTRPSRSRKKATPGWVWLSAGLLLGLLLATAAWFLGWVSPPKEPVIRPDPKAKAQQTVAESLPEPKKIEPKYQFYDELTKPIADQTSPQKPARQSETSDTQYWLQVGAFRKESDADEVKARLAFLGVESILAPGQSGHQTWFRVRVGPFTSRRSREAMQRKLQNNGFEPLVLQSSE